MYHRLMTSSGIILAIPGAPHYNVNSEVQSSAVPHPWTRSTAYSNNLSQYHYQYNAWPGKIHFLGKLVEYHSHLLLQAANSVTSGLITFN